MVGMTASLWSIFMVVSVKVGRMVVHGLKVMTMTIMVIITTAS